MTVIIGIFSSASILIPFFGLFYVILKSRYELKSDFILFAFSLYASFIAEAYINIIKYTAVMFRSKAYFSAITDLNIWVAELFLPLISLFTLLTILTIIKSNKYSYLLVILYIMVAIALIPILKSFNYPPLLRFNIQYLFFSVVTSFVALFAFDTQRKLLTSRQQYYYWKFQRTILMSIGIYSILGMFGFTISYLFPVVALYIHTTGNLIQNIMFAKGLLCLTK
jgi:hypothetical protein